VSKANPVVFVWAFLVVAPAPFFVCFAVSPAGETQIWPGDLRVVAAVFGFFLVHDLPRDYGTKVFHNVSNLFTRFSQCQDRASERNRPQQRKTKKKYSMHQRELSQVLRNATIDIKVINALKTKHSKAKNGVNGNDQIEKPW